MGSYYVPKQLSEQDQHRLDDLYAMLSIEAEQFAGYPCTAWFDYSPLYRFLKFPFNNVGDPYLPSNYHLNTHEFEREVLEEFVDLTGGLKHETWGYLTNGGTEGNMYGMFLARELQPQGIVYYSEDTHYSVNKILRCLHVRNIMIKSRSDGSIDLDDLRETIRIHRDVPPILFLNAGTTMTGAIDDVAGVRQILDDLAIHRYYIHIDAALHGMILPFVDQPQPWDFQAGADSIAISGHKFIGSPVPCGVALAKKANVDRIARSVEYIGTLDTTLSGSRNAFSSLVLWYAFRTVGRDGFRERVEGCFDMADYAIQRLETLGVHPWRHLNSPIVVIDRPPQEVIERWQLAVNNQIAHIITMPHVTRQHIEGIAHDIVEHSNSGAVALQEV